VILLSANRYRLVLTRGWSRSSVNRCLWHLSCLVDCGNGGRVVAADRQDSHDAQPSRLADLLEGFKSYIGERSAWSDRAMKVWRREFREFGIEGKTADDLIAVAHEQLLRHNTYEEGQDAR
jgi:hypothetical protein